MSMPDPLSFIKGYGTWSNACSWIRGGHATFTICYFGDIIDLCVLYQSCPTDIRPFNGLLSLLSGTAKAVQTFIRDIGDVFAQWYGAVLAS